MDLVHKGPLLFTNPNASILPSIFSSYMQIQGLRSPKEMPKKAPSKPLAESPHFGTNDEEVSPKGKFDLFHCNEEHEVNPNAKQGKKYTSYDPQGAG